MSIKFKDVLKNKQLRAKIRARAHNLRRRNGNPDSFRTTHIEDEIYRKLRTGGGAWSEIEFDDSTHLMKVVNYVLKEYIGPEYGRDCDAGKKKVFANSASTDGDSAWVLPSQDPSVLSQVDRLQRLDGIQRTMETLKRQKPDWARVVELHVVEDLTLEDVSRVMGVPHGTVRNWWRSAAKRLRAAWAR